MSRRSGRRLHASDLVSNGRSSGRTFHETKQDIRGDCPFVRFIQHNDRVFRTVRVDQQFSQKNTIRLDVSA